MRILTLLLTLLLVFSLVACGGSSSDESTPAFSTATSTPKEEPKPESSTPVSSAVESTEAPVESTEAPVDSSVDESTDTSEEEVEPFEPIDYGTNAINKAPGAIEIDGVVSEGEYATVFEYDANSVLWSSGSDEEAKNYSPKVYLAWDEEYLYTAVTLVPGRPRSYDGNEYLELKRPYIFDRRHLMSAVVLGNPTDEKYVPSTGNAWDWGEASLTGVANEWSVSAQPDGTMIQANHFGEVIDHAGWKYANRSEGYEIEVYEQKIPWAAFATDVAFEAKAGAVIGYAFSAACEEIDITVEDGEDENSIHACFGAGINNGKNFAHYVGLTLAE